MKWTTLTITLLLISFICQAQDADVYHLRHKTYDSFVMFGTDDETGYVRVKYEIDGQKKVAQYKFKLESYNRDGVDGVLLNGYGAEMLVGDGSYSPDNFIFIEDGFDFDVYTADDNKIGSGSAPFSQFNKAKLVSHREYDYYTSTFLSGFGLTNSHLSETGVDLLEYTFVNNTPKPEERETIMMSSSSTSKNNVYFVVMDNRFTDGNSYRDEGEFPSDFVSEKWDDDYYITDVSYYNGEWVINMIEDAYTGNQSYKISSTFPREWVITQWERDRYITNATYADGSWLLVATEDDNVIDQGVYFSSDYPMADMREWYVSDHKIMDLTYGDGMWLFFHTEYSYTAPYQRFYLDEEFPDDWIKEQWGEDYIITDIDHMNGKWMVIMESKDGVYQTYKTSESMPGDWIREQWNGDRDLTISNITFGPSN